MASGDPSLNLMQRSTAYKMNKFVKPHQLAQQAIRLQEYNSKTAVDDSQIILPPVQTNRIVASEFIPTTNSSGCWNAESNLNAKQGMNVYLDS